MGQRHRKLKSETNTPRMEKRVLDAFEKSDIAHAIRSNRLGRFRIKFEHGQWFITDLDSGAQWAVVDAADAYSGIDGFDFEQVTAGEEEYW